MVPHWMNGALLPVMVSIDFKRLMDLTKGAVVVAVVFQERPDDALVQRLCCDQDAVDLILRAKCFEKRR